MAHRRLTDLSEKDVRESIEAVMALADGPQPADLSGGITRSGRVRARS